MQKNFLSFGLVLVFAVVALGQSGGAVYDPTTMKVVVNDLHTGGNQDLAYVEICNFGTTPVDISGWLLIFHSQNPAVGVGNIDAMECRHEIGANVDGLGTPGAGIHAGWATNPAGPGPALDIPAGTVILQPGECFVVEEINGAASVGMPAGAQYETMQTTFGVGLGFDNFVFASVPHDIQLYDVWGNGVDGWHGGGPILNEVPGDLAAYLGALGVVNPAPITDAWTDGGSPVFTSTGGARIARGRSNNTDQRNTSGVADSDTGDDWTNDSTNSAGTPGMLNPFQYDGAALDPVSGNPVYGIDGINVWVPAGAANCAAGFGSTMTASFSTSPAPDPTSGSITGCAPTAVVCTNTSLGVCYPTSNSWDWDAVSAPATVTGAAVNMLHIYGGPGDIQLTLVDAAGGFAQSGVQNVATVANLAFVPQSLPLREDFESWPPLVADPCGCGNVPDPTTGWQYSCELNSRFRVTSAAGVAVGWVGMINPDTCPGDQVLLLDSTGGTSTNTMSLHFDTINVPVGTTGFEIRMYAIENFDENHPQDCIFLQDGITFGDGVDLTGASTGSPGYENLQEYLLADFNAAVGGAHGQRLWGVVSFTVDFATLAAAGLLAQSPDMRLVFRQADNVTFEGNDGMGLDQIQIIPIPEAVLAGNPGQPGTAVLSVDCSLNANGRNPFDGVAGPFSAAVSGGFTMTFEGGPSQPIILLAGNLAVNTIAFPGPPLQIDIAPVNIVTDPLTGSGFLPALFYTAATDGRMNLSISTGAAALGTIGTVQAVFVGGPGGVAISNAVEISVN